MLQWNSSAGLPPAIGAVGAPRGVSWNRGSLGIAPIPWTDCWGPPAGTNPNEGPFKTCHNQAFSDAQSQCQGYNPNRYNSYDDCVNQTKDVLVGAKCLKFCKPSAATYRGSDPCNSAAAVAYLQKQLGVGSDGSFGPVTRAALEKNGSTMQGLIGCTGPCPSSVPANLCAGDCLPGFERDPATGKCTGSGGGGGGTVPPPPGKSSGGGGVGAAILAGLVLVAGGVALFRSG